MDFLRNSAVKSAMADATKTTARPTGHMTYTQAPAACEKNIFHLFRFTQPVKNHTSLLRIMQSKVATYTVCKILYGRVACISSNVMPRNFLFNIDDVPRAFD